MEEMKYSEVLRQKLLEKVSEVAKAWAGVTPTFPLDTQAILEFYHILKNEQNILQILPKNAYAAIDRLYDGFLKCEKGNPSLENEKKFGAASVEIRKIVREIKDNQNSKTRQEPIFQNDVEKMMYAARKTEEVFKTRNMDGHCKLALYLNSGDVTVFTREQGIREMVADVNYQKLKLDLAKSVIVNANKCIQQGIFETSNTLINNAINIITSNTNLTNEALTEKLIELLGYFTFYDSYLGAYTGNYEMVPALSQKNENAEKGASLK